MSLLIGFLTLVLILNCLFLILLVLIQLPKKEAGAGIAFGGGATDALFGAGSGNALTKVTKYSAALFLGLALLLTVLNAQRAKQSGKGLERALNAAAKAPATAPLISGTAPASNQVLQLQPNATPAPAAATTTLSNSAPAAVKPTAQPATTPAAPKK
jgi:protein translocase SecG subunit